MNDFSIWFSEGFEHIVSAGAYDHLLFLSLLVFAVPHGEWMKVLLLLVCFTLGHSLSLLLSLFDILILPASLVEALIALTIIITAGYEIYTVKKEITRDFGWLLVLVGLFGMIHGLGFSFTLLSLLGSADSIILPLLYFNLGIEAGQVIIVAAILLFSLLLAGSLKIKLTSVKLIFACIALIVSLFIFVQRLQLFYSP